MKLPELIEGLKRIINYLDDDFKDLIYIWAALDVIKRQSKAPVLQPHILLLELYEARKANKTAKGVVRYEEHFAPLLTDDQSKVIAARGNHKHTANRAGAALRACLAYAKKFKEQK